jgi:WD40 repeat protein
MGSPGEVAAGCKDSHLRIVDKSTGHVRIDIDTGQKEINGLALSPDQTILATAGDDGTVQLWDVAAGNRVAEFHASDEPIFQISWSADGKSIVTAGNAQDVKIWDAEDFELKGTISSQGEALECLSVGSNGAIAFGSDKGVTRIARFNTQGELSVQNVSVFMSRSFNVNRCSTVVFSPSSRMLAVGLDNGYLVLLPGTTRELSGRRTHPLFDYCNSDQFLGG